MEEDIEILENYIREWNDTDVAQTLQNLIARYKELEDKNKTLETLLQGNLYQMYLYYKELAGRYQANSISKNKVKEKIEELEEYVKDFENRMYELGRLEKESENLKIDRNNYIQTNVGAFKTRKMDVAFLNKINELIQAVKQLDRKVNSN